MKKLVLLLLLPVALFSQKYENVMISKSSPMRRGICEPSISINKANRANVTAGAILDKVFYSNDSGKTWTADTLKSTYGVWGDPVLTSDYAGNQYFFHLSDPTGENWKSEEILDRIVCQRSEDGGKTWNNGSYMGLAHPKDQDKHWVTVNPNTNALYCTWTQFDKYGSKAEEDKSNIMFSKSEDFGDSWSEAIAISQYPGNCLDDDKTTEGAVPAAGPDGKVYVAWGYNEKIYFDRIDADGNHLEEDIIIADQPGGWDIDVPGLQRANGMPVTVCDVSNGPNRGTIYVNWVDDRNGNYDVWLSKSTDKGNSWSKPQRINDDKSKRDQFFTWIACDPVTGHLYTVFYDRRNTKGNETEVYMAHSTDGGKTWKNEKISEKSFTPNDAVFFGDYNDIDAYDGMVRPIWTRMEKDGSMSIWTALIEIK